MKKADTARIRIRVVAVAACLGLAFASLGATCVDGITPDCTSPDAACGPQIDAAPETGTTLPEGGNDASDAASDVASDAADAADAADAPDDAADTGAD